MASLPNDSTITFQSNIKTHNMANITDYAYFLGGLNVTRNALEQYDPLKTGFGRLFMIRKPKFVADPTRGIPNKLSKFKHVLEYANIGVEGLSNIQLDFNPLQGGYTNRQMDIPNIAKDEMNSFTVKTYEFSGSLMREVIQFWINGVSDIQTGLSHYNGVALPIAQANQTAEFIYAVTDQSGLNIEYACLLANCMPKEIKLDPFNYSSGDHALVQLDIEFTCTRYMSPQINNLAAMLILKYGMLMNSLNFHSGMKASELASDGQSQGSRASYNPATGKLAWTSDATETFLQGNEKSIMENMAAPSNTDYGDKKYQGRSAFDKSNPSTTGT